MSTEVWPPPPTEERPWHEQALRLRENQGLKSWIAVRVVRLWGQDVLIDQDARVYCSDCWRFRSVEVLGGPFNGCRVGLPTQSGRWRVTVERPGGAQEAP